MEQWRAVPGYEGYYEVSDIGRVRAPTRPDALGRIRKAKILSPRTMPSGHKAIALSVGRVRRSFLVHHLVLMAFVGPRPDGLEGLHWNDVPDDNRVENLRWDTRRANILDSVRNGTHGMASRTHCPKGHAYTEGNIYWYPATDEYPAGRRACNECRRTYREQHQEERREKGREYMRRRRAEAKTRKAA